LYRTHVFFLLKKEKEEERKEERKKERKKERKTFGDNFISWIAVLLSKHFFFLL
jgi:hypothetical protein